MPTRRVEGTHNGGDTVAGPLPLYYAGRRATLGERVAPPLRVLCQLCVSIKREREKERKRRAGGGGGGEERKSFRVMHDAGHGMIRDIDA